MLRRITNPFNHNFDMPFGTCRRAEADAIRAASILAPALEDALEELFTRLFATIMLSPGKELQKAYAELETLADCSFYLNIAKTSSLSLPQACGRAKHSRSGFCKPAERWQILLNVLVSLLKEQDILKFLIKDID